MPELTYREAIREALREEMRRDETVFLLGQDIGKFGSTSKVTEGLIDEFGAERVMDTPIAEVGMVGLALGAALAGMRPVVGISYADFSLIASDMIANYVAKAHYASNGRLTASMVIRTMQSGPGVAGGYDHTQRFEAIFAHIPGLIVVFPATPYDAKGVLKSAIRDDNPVLFMEDRPMYGIKGHVPDEEYLVPLGKADIKREGKDVTVVAIARNVVQSLEAAKALAEEGIDIEIVDPITIRPLDKETIIRSVKKTGRLVIVHDASKTGGIGAEIAASVAEEALDYLDQPIVRLAGLDTMIPANPKLEVYVRPTVKSIIDTVKKLVK